MATEIRRQLNIDRVAPTVNEQRYFESKEIGKMDN